MAKAIRVKKSAGATGKRSNDGAETRLAQNGTGGEVEHGYHGWGRIRGVLAHAGRRMFESFLSFLSLRRRRRGGAYHAPGGVGRGVPHQPEIFVENSPFFGRGYGGPLKEIRRVSGSDTAYRTSRYGVSLPKARRRARALARTRTRVGVYTHACRRIHPHVCAYVPACAHKY